MVRILGSITSNGESFSAFSELDRDTELVFREEPGSFIFAFLAATGLVADIETPTYTVENRSLFSTIDRVLLPKVAVDFFIQNYMDSVLEFIMNLEDCKDLHEVLEGNTQVPVPSFITNGKAFTFLLPSQESLIEFEQENGDLSTQEGRELLANVLSYHFVFRTKLRVSDIDFSQSYVTFQKGEISFDWNFNSEIEVLGADGTVQAVIISEDNAISGGVVHIIDNVLSPPKIAFPTN